MSFSSANINFVFDSFLYLGCSCLAAESCREISVYGVEVLQAKLIFNILCFSSASWATE